MDTIGEFYQTFLETVSQLTANDISLYLVDTEPRLNTFYESLQNEDMFTLFAGGKIKAFSSKSVETHALSISLFGDSLTLKQVFNNQPDTVKDRLWEGLFNLYIQLERTRNNNATRINTLKECLKTLRHATSHSIKGDMFKNILNANVNGSTNNMLDDIISSFQDVVSNKGNPFENIMGITEKIAAKYGNKLESGEIEVNKIFDGMGNLLNGFTAQQEPVVIDEKFSTSTVEVGTEDAQTAFDLTKLMPLASMVTKIGNVKTEEDVLSLKKEMDTFMEKELKVDMTQYNENIVNLEKKLEDLKLNSQAVEE